MFEFEIDVGLGCGLIQDMIGAYDMLTRKSVKTRIANIMVTIGLSISGVTSSAVAITLMPGEAQVLTQSLVSDLDYSGLRAFFGVDFVKNSYSFTSDQTMYTGLLSGTYLGNDLEVDYFGDSSDFLQTGVITYNSQGFWGDEEWSGAGTIQITEINESEFQFNLDSSLNIGANTVNVSGIFTGTASDNDLELTSSSGTVEYNSQDGEQTSFFLEKPSSNLKECELSDPLLQIVTVNRKIVLNGLFLSRVEIFECKIVGKNRLEYRRVEDFKILNNILVDPPAPPPAPPVEKGDGKVYLVKAPEPTSTLSLLALGTLGAASTFKRNKKKKSTEKETTKVG